MSTRATTILNEQGDITVAWEPEDDALMEAVIAKKMAEGVVFFLIVPRMGGLQAPDKIAAGSVDAVMARRAYAIRDADLAAFVGAPGITPQLAAPGHTPKLIAGPVDEPWPPEDVLGITGNTHPPKRGRTARAVKTPAAPAVTTKKAKTAKEAASTETVGVRPMRGG